MITTHDSPTRLLAPEHRQAIKAVVTWLATREREGRPLPTTARELEDDIEHSALLHRLLVEEKPPLPVPPPRSYRTPWYELVEQGYAHCIVEQVDRGLVINGNPWEIVALPGPGQYRVRYRADGPDYLVWRVGLALPAADDQSSWMIEVWTGE